MTISEIAPCPFCGKSEFLVEQLDSDASVVICQGMVDQYSACLARGPVGVQEDESEDQPGRDAAIRLWNQRAGHSIAGYEGSAGLYYSKQSAVANGEQRIEPIYKVKK